MDWAYAQPTRRPRVGCRSCSRASSIPTTPSARPTRASPAIVVSNHGGRTLDGRDPHRGGAARGRRGGGRPARGLRRRRHPAGRRRAQGARAGRPGSAGRAADPVGPRAVGGEDGATDGPGARLVRELVEDMAFSGCRRRPDHRTARPARPAPSPLPGLPGCDPDRAMRVRDRAIPARAPCPVVWRALVGGGAGRGAGRLARVRPRCWEPTTCTPPAATLRAVLRGLADARRVGPADAPGPPGAAGGRQPVPHPGCRREDDRHARPPDRRSGGPGPGRRVAGGAGGPRHRRGTTVGATSASWTSRWPSSGRSWRARRSPPIGPEYTVDGRAPRPRRCRHVCPCSWAPRVRRSGLRVVARPRGPVADVGPDGLDRRVPGASGTCWPRTALAAGSRIRRRSAATGSEGHHA